MSELERVAQAAAATLRARKELDRQIRAAHKAGQPLRAIAEVAGVSHEQVRRIVS